MISILPDFNSIFRICDWIELYILCDSSRLSKSKLINMLNANGIGSTDDVHSTEVLVADIHSELERRERMMGDNPIFTLDDNQVVRRNGHTWEDVPEYVMCLVFSLQGVKKIKGDEDGTKLFERIGKDVIASYLDGNAIVLGFPNSMSLNAQIEELAVKTNEIKSQDRCPANTDKDKGVDIIGWKEHKDGRNNQIVLLIQVAAGYHWNMKKAVSKKAWRDFVMWSADLNIGILVASTLDEIRFQKANDDYNLVFDRIRIFISLYRRNLTIDNALRLLVKDWCVKELNFEAA
ncbi:hypothetical protein [Winogradskyella immobilis]|uniref:Uncharacterized protein n=1 Tax=Winogradskyella immobilis TaxID=2816852 RepID=A0ABS8ER03_9FLAO|nr:hypothetical protein [Winogradskyella immobilis]MCC1485641.1 hypothetical protein [Winogradskyella immobilis]MCG0017733.1 hypothetical protein [Winogradskyella immobilis]